MTAEKVRFNVRGKILETTASTLAAARRDSMFGAMFDDEWKLQPRGSDELVKPEEKEYFIDRDPDCFSVLLNLLGTGKLHVPCHIPEKLLYMEAHYYGLLDHVRTAKWGEFDSNRLRLTGSVSGQAPRNCSAIRASPDGGCAVAHGGVVRVYDWMLEEHPPLNLEYQSVNDIGWMDSDNIVMAVSQNLDRTGVGGMGVFSALTGELRQRFQLSDGEDQVKGFSAGALCFNTDSNKVLASCRDITSNQGIGVWDQETGKQTDFFDFGLGSDEEIQWFNGRNCLLVNSCIKYKRRINLLDFRDKKSVVWSWPDDTKTCHSHTHIHDAIPMEEGNSICVVDQSRNLGFLDLRDTAKSVRWNLYRGKDTAQSNYTKLTLHGGQIFCSVGDKISVYYYDGLDQWVLTSNLEGSHGGSVRDFSIGGDRLFALHTEKNVFDVWETPSAPII